MGSKRPRPGVQDDQAENRVKDMDDEGTDVHFLIPTSWLSLVGVADPAIEVGMIRAYHRHMADFCGQYPDRLKSMIVASTRGVDEAVREIREWGNSKWAVAVMPLLAEGLPGGPPRPRADLAGRPGTRSADRQPQLHLDPALLSRLPGSLGQHLPRPARRASLGRDAVRRVVHRRRAVRPLPEAADGRARMRLRLAAVLGRRMDEQAVYVGGTAPLKMKPSEYMTSGRFFCSIEHHEGEDMFEYVTRFLGDDVLMYASDYPHSECQFPDSVANILAWSSLGAEQQRKLLWENANRFFRQT